MKRRTTDAILVRLVHVVVDYAADAPSLRNELLDDIKTLRGVIDTLSKQKRGGR